MRVSKVLLTSAFVAQLLLVFVLQDSGTDATPQQPSLDFPVQLIGFPVIIIAVRLSNFVKKLAYSLNPKTYTSRVRRELPESKEELIDVAEAEKRLVAELGENVCIYTRVCLQYAHRAQRNKNRSTRVLDWDHILQQYKRSPDRKKEFYLLSVFMGDIVASPKFCQQLAKRGRACSANQ